MSGTAGSRRTLLRCPSKADEAKVITIANKELRSRWRAVCDLDGKKWGQPSQQKAPVREKPRIGGINWISTRPIYVAESGRALTKLSFPTRDRELFCYICGDHTSEDDNNGGEMRECSTSNCGVKFHVECVQSHSDGGYTYNFMTRNKGVHCPRHHCASCFADHNRVRCFNGKLVGCSQCELSWHVDGCVPGGCSVDPKTKDIVCPRHVSFVSPPLLHTTHCCDCQQRPANGEKLTRCTTCLRSFHQQCFKESSPLECSPSVNAAVCNWCRGFDFVRYGQYCMGRLGALKWFPCQVVRNEEYVDRTDPLLGSVGYMAVKWLLRDGTKPLFNLLPHNRVIPMSEADYFFVTEAESSGMYEEWKMAQGHAAANCAESRLPRPDQISFLYSNNHERVKKITKNRYTTPDTRPQKDQLEVVSLCHCLRGKEGRCGPASECINRALRLECPEECGLLGKCHNRAISSGQNCAPLSIISKNARYFGAIIMQDIEQDGFVGEYVGEVISWAEKERRLERIGQFQSLEAQYYIIDLDNHRAIDAEFYGNDMRYINHSCRPNTSVDIVTTANDVHIALYALRAIKKGEELSFDYNMYSNTSGRAVPRCRCMAPNCTGVLAAKKTTLKPVKDDSEKENAPLNKRTASKTASKPNKPLSLPKPAVVIEPELAKRKRPLSTAQS